jgi:hypothetical protein
VTVQLSHYLVDNELGVSPDIKALYLEFGGDVQAIYEGLILCHIIGSAKM